MEKMNRRRFAQTAMTGAAVATAVAPTAPAAVVVNGEQGLGLPENARVCISHVGEDICIIWEWVGGKFVERFRGPGTPPDWAVTPNDLFQK